MTSQKTKKPNLDDQIRVRVDQRLARLFDESAAAEALDASSWLRHCAVLKASGRYVETPAASTVEPKADGNLTLHIRIRITRKHKTQVEAAAARDGVEVATWVRRVGVLRANGLLVEPCS